MLTNRFLVKHPHVMWVKKNINFYKNLKFKLKKQLKFEKGAPQPIALSSKFVPTCTWLVS